jgi:hypothetical protein
MDSWRSEMTILTPWYGEQKRHCIFLHEKDLHVFCGFHKKLEQYVLAFNIDEAISLTRIKFSEKKSWLLNTLPRKGRSVSLRE